MGTKRVTKGYKNTKKGIKMGQNITRKIQLVPIGDKKEISRVYNYLSKHIEAQNKAMN